MSSSTQVFFFKSRNLYWYNNTTLHGSYNPHSYTDSAAHHHLLSLTWILTISHKKAAVLSTISVDRTYQTFSWSGLNFRLVKIMPRCFVWTYSKSLQSKIVCDTVSTPQPRLQYLLVYSTLLNRPDIRVDGMALHLASKYALCSCGPLSTEKNVAICPVLIGMYKSKGEHVLLATFSRYWCSV